MAVTVLSRFSTALTTGIDATKRVFGDPTGVEGATPLVNYVPRNEYYNRLWAYYNNTAFDDSPLWEAYREKFGLYRYQRSIYNPTRRLVKFYVDQIFPGFATAIDVKLPEGIRRAIEFENTSPELLGAINQFWHWTNFRELKNIVVLRGAALGNTLVELVDDLDRKKVWAKCWWPGHVVDIELDDPSRGNVIYYVLEYRAKDEQGNPYLLRKEVDRKTIKYFRDGEPFDYTGYGAVIQNPYPFVPAVWIRHNNVGETFGQPAIAASLAKIDELNMLVSRAHDRLFTMMQAPIVFSSGGASGDLADIGITNPTRKTTSDEMATSTENRANKSGRERIRIIDAPEGSSVSTITLDVGSTLNWVKSLIEEIEAEHRELSVFRELSKMSITTGPAMQRIMKDVNEMVLNAQGPYDEQMQSLFRMAVAIGGWRANNGDWGSKSQLTVQQEKFLPFDLESFDKGDLDMIILPREMFPLSEQDKWAIEKSKNDALFVAKQLDVPAEQRFIQWGATPEQAQQWVRDAERADALDQMRAIELKTATAQQPVAGRPVDSGGANPGPKPQSFGINNNGRPVPRRAATANATPNRAGNNSVRRVSVRKNQ